jgi:transcriptional regulator
MIYPPPYYTDDNPAFAHRIMREHGFALLVVEGLAATHLPLLFSDEGERGALYGHVARSNPVCERLNGAPALAVFSGPHTYVSATLYDDPSVNVLTWNYASVQVRGHVSTEPDAALPSHLTELAQAYEGHAGWSVSDAPDYVSRISRGIVAVRLEISTIQAFRKMSGNKSPAMRKRIIDAARARGEDAFANEMETLRHD